MWVPHGRRGGDGVYMKNAPFPDCGKGAFGIKEKFFLKYKIPY